MHYAPTTLRDGPGRVVCLHHSSAPRGHPYATGHSADGAMMWCSCITRRPAWPSCHATLPQATRYQRCPARFAQASTCQELG